MRSGIFMKVFLALGLAFIAGMLTGSTGAVFGVTFVRIFWTCGSAVS